MKNLRLLRNFCVARLSALLIYPPINSVARKTRALNLRKILGFFRFRLLHNFCVVASALLSGCSIMSPVDITPMNSYRLTAVAPQSAPVKSSNMTMLVSIPETVPGYESNAMAYVKQRYELAYFTENRWVSSPSAMLGPLLVESLQNTHRFRAVAETPYAGFSDVRLDANLTDLYQDFTVKPSREVVGLSVTLVDLHTHRTLTSEKFRDVEVAPEDTPYGGVIAANRAVSKLLGNINDFVLKNTMHMSAPPTIQAQITALEYERSPRAYG